MAETEIIAAEIFEERAAICEYSGLLTRKRAEELGLLESMEYLRDCEINTILAMPFDKRRPFLAEIEIKRGKPHADKLRELVQKEWLWRKSQANAERKAA